MIVKTTKSWRAAAERIRNEIRDGVHPGGTTLPAETELASRLGISRGTLRKAVDYLIESGDLIRKPHSSPVVSAGKSRANLARDVYLWVSQPISHASALQVVKGVSRGLAGTKYRMVVREPSRFDGNTISVEERKFLLDLLSTDDVAGAIIERDPFAHDDDLFTTLARRKHLVFVDAPPPVKVEADFVGTANIASARACVEHLLNLGHTHVVCVADTDVPTPARDRITGYMRAMRQASLESYAKVVVACDLPSGREIQSSLAGSMAGVSQKSSLYSGWPINAVEEILSMRPRPTALFVCHDAMAQWMCALLEGRGLSIPRDMSVVGFDWLAGFDPSLPDVLTTAAQDFEGFGWQAANLLLDHLTGEEIIGPRQVLLNAPLVIRSTTASNLVLPSREMAKARGA